MPAVEKQEATTPDGDEILAEKFYRASTCVSNQCCAAQGIKFPLGKIHCPGSDGDIAERQIGRNELAVEVGQALFLARLVACFDHAHRLERRAAD